MKSVGDPRPVRPLPLSIPLTRPRIEIERPTYLVSRASGTYGSTNVSRLTAMAPAPALPPPPSGYEIVRDRYAFDTRAHRPHEPIWNPRVKSVDPLPEVTYDFVSAWRPCPSSLPCSQRLPPTLCYPLIHPMAPPPPFNYRIRMRSSWSDPTERSW